MRPLGVWVVVTCPQACRYGMSLAKLSGCGHAADPDSSQVEQGFGCCVRLARPAHPRQAQFVHPVFSAFRDNTTVSHRNDELP